MTTDIFIRTYSKDIPWLEYCLKSIHKFGSRFRDIKICIPEGQEEYMDMSRSGTRLKEMQLEHIVTCQRYENDYVGQQLTKMSASEFSDADYIFFCDSDLIFTEPFTPEDYIIKGKPVILKEDFENFKIPHPDAYARKKWLSDYFGWEVKYEYMRRHPFVYERKLLELSALLSRKEFPKDIGGMSEFNIMGNLADKFFPDRYKFLEVGKDKIPESKIKQFWSWGGLTPEIKTEIENILK